MASSSSSSLHPATKVPRVGVGIFIFNGTSPSTSHEVLLGKRLGSHGAGTMALPGGHLELHESFEACAAREALEETGVEVNQEDVRVLSVVNSVHMGREEEHVGDGEERKGKHYVTIFTAALAKPKDGESLVKPVNTEPEKCQGWAWVPFDWLAHTASLQSSVERMSNEAKQGGISNGLPVSNAKLLRAQKLAEAMRGNATSSALATGMGLTGPQEDVVSTASNGGERGAVSPPSSSSILTRPAKPSQSEAEGEEEEETRRKAEWIAADAFAGDAPLFGPLVRLFEQRERVDIDAKLIW